ncbi:hypothetical protein HGRIS_013412 [Hohenbuehelia grisea]|uniref:Peptidase S9 prolyl oligopeptidase catalytic domain-containing protein n=1 Tax=Hohenbuehelia grisea TaxID=104357 RepID=A0ABR3IVL7_9AGAR
MTSESTQAILRNASTHWRLELSTEWDVLGPFPLHAREQTFLSPSFPIDLSKPIDYNQTWPSSYADGGHVSWKKINSDNEGDLNISFQNIRWSALRATEGWAALQHHAILRATLTVIPPEAFTSTDLQHPVPSVLVQLVQGSFFAITPSLSQSDQNPAAPAWHAGNIYNLERSLPQVVNLPTPPSMTAPTEYNMFISGDYEIRLFGDPAAQKRAWPVQNINVQVGFDNAAPGEPLLHEASQDVICDFVDGRSFGDALGIAIRSTNGWWTVTNVSLKGEATKAFDLSIVRPATISPSQTRIIPILVSQHAPFHDAKFDISLFFTQGSSLAEHNVSVTLEIAHHIQWVSDAGPVPLKGTYFYAETNPTAFSAIPPMRENGRAEKPPLLFLHGAGAEVVNNPWWVEYLPRMEHSWVIAPSGRTSWGLDWHGPSARDAWASLDALVKIIHQRPQWKPWALAPQTRAIVMGHSNGGQGAWYLASRFPDRTLAVVPAAAYIKSQSYVPLTMSRSAHFIDPVLRAILESSLTPDDNDLFIPNLLDTPLLAVHGGVDENVPVWHSREYVSVLKTWNPEANATFIEDPNQPHLYPSQLTSKAVHDFLDGVLAQHQDTYPRIKSFLLTASIPSESSSLHGFRVLELEIPGRLGRIEVETSAAGRVQVTPRNVHSFTIDLSLWPNTSFAVNDDNLMVQTVTDNILISRTASGEWQSASFDNSAPPIASQFGRVQSILISPGPLTIVVPSKSPSRELSVAQRIAHDLGVYHRLDAEISLEHDIRVAWESGILSPGNVIVIGRHTSDFVNWLLGKKQTPFATSDSGFAVANHKLREKSLGAVVMHPHPHSASSVLLLLGTDDAGLERAARLFPIRTGVATPDWVVLDARSDNVGAGGVIGAGVWGRGFSLNSAMSWLY